MSDWKYAQQSADEKLARLHQFSVTKKHAGGEIELIITIREYATPTRGHLQFFAETDKYLNQKQAPFRPCGWSDSLMGALAECLRNIRRFEYEGEEASSAQAG